MASGWRDVKVFISSTFRDMHAERDWLVKRVFPALRERLAPYRIHLIDVDLRWGVTSEQADNDQALDLCLQQIDDCRPLFVGLLGERYGWVPEEYPEMDVAKFGWIQHQTGKSITELEILYGVLRKHEMQGRAFFCFRKPAFLVDLPGPQQLYDCAEFPNNDERKILAEGKLSRRESRARVIDRRNKLRRLKQEIREAEPPVPIFEDYPCHYQGLKINWRIAQQKLGEADRQTLHEIASDGIIDPHEYASLNDAQRKFVDANSVAYLDGLKEFGKHVEQRLWAAIQAQYELPATPPSQILAKTDPLANEADYHNRFMESRLRVYIGREKVQQALTEFADGDDTRPCLVTGPSGSGKSAALAKFVTTFRKAHPDFVVIPHFVGASPGSTDLRQVLRRFCLVLQTQLSFDDEIPQEINKLTLLFHDFLKRVPNDRRVLLAIDALNQLDETDGAHSLNWLPHDLPGHVKLITSCIDDADRTEAVREAFRQRKLAHIVIEPLTDEERLEIVHQIPSLSAKTLDPEQIGLLLANPATTNPLFLLVALEELRGFGSFEELNDHIEAFPREGDAVTELFGQVLERLEIEFGEQLMRSLFRLLSSARRGLSEQELQGLLAEDTQSENLFPVLCQARAYLQPRGELIDFFHRSLYKAVRDRYLQVKTEQHAAHHQLAEYFHRQLNPDGAEPWSGDSRRAIAELPYHQRQGESWSDLETTLTDLRFIQARCTSGMTYELVRDYAEALEALPELQQERDEQRQRQERMRQYGADLAAYAQAKGGRIALPVPPDTRASQELMRQAEAASLTVGEQDQHPSAAPKIADSAGVSPSPILAPEPSRASRIRAFANFASMHSHVLGQFPEEAMVVARNHAADGPVVQQAEDLAAKLRTPWLQRDPRPPAPLDKTAPLRTLEGHTNHVSAVALTPDGRTAVSASEDKTLRVWDVATGKCLRTLEGHTDSVSDVALTPDGHTAVSASGDKTLRVWNVATGKCLRTLEGHTDSVSAVALTPDGHTAVSASGDKTLRVWNVATGKCLRTLEGHTAPVSAVALTPDGLTAVSASDKNPRMLDVPILHVWNVPTGQCLRTLEGHAAIVRTVALTVDGHTAVSASNDKTLRVWDVATGKCLRTLEGHTAPIRTVAVTLDGHTAVSASNDNTLRVWDVATGQCLRTLEGHTASVNAVALMPDGHAAVSASVDNTLRVWDVATGKLLTVYPLNGLGLSFDIGWKKRIVVGTDSGQLHFLTLRNCRPPDSSRVRLQDNNGSPPSMVLRDTGESR